MVLWTVAIVLTIVFLALLLLIYIRKVQYDAVHRNFLDLEDEYGGQIERGGFAIRPKYSGAYKGQPFAVSFTTEKDGDDRRYYITVTMQGRARHNFTVMSREWLGIGKIDEARQKEALAIDDNRYLMESVDPGVLKKVNVPTLENIIQHMHPFAWMLIGKSQILLERVSLNIIEDTKLDALRPLLEGLFQIQEAMA